MAEKKYIIDNPALMAEWNWEKNNELGLNPRLLTSGSNKKVWWRCHLNHSWQAVIAKRVNGGKCPVCQGKAIEKGFNDLSTTHPNLKDEWDFLKNVDLTPDMVSKGSDRKIWWKCHLNHSWQASISSRANGCSCPFCAKELQSSFPEKAIYYYISKYIPNTVSGYKFSELNNLELDIYIPQYQIGIEYDGDHWHQNIDKDLKKNLILTQKGIRLIRVREPKCPVLNDGNSINLTMTDKKSELSSIIERVLCEISKISGEPYSIVVDLEKDNSQILQSLTISHKRHNLSIAYPLCAKEWDYEKNNGLLPESFKVGSDKKVWWICPQGHSYSLSVFDKVNGRGCPVCAGKVVLPGYNDFASKCPELLLKWDYNKNIMSPNKIAFGSDKKCWWLCQYGHSYVRSINNERALQSCPICSGKTVLSGFNDIATTHPSVVSEWCYELNEYNPTQLSAGSHKKVWWRCSICGHKWQAVIYARTAGHGCPKCYKKKK